MPTPTVAARITGLEKKNLKTVRLREKQYCDPLVIVCYGPRKERGIIHAVYLPARS